jgi:hypothetical protein
MIKPPQPIGPPYRGATEDELRLAGNAKRALALADQSLLFPHQGLFELRDDTMVLGDWRTIARSQVTGVDLAFTAVYSRWLAAGARGNYPSFGAFGSLGKPLIVRIVDGAPLYLLLEFSRLTGINRNRKWYPLVVGWLNGSAA